MPAPRTVPNALIGVLAASALLVGCTSSTGADQHEPSVEAVQGPSLTAGTAQGLPEAPAPVPPAAPVCGDPAAAVAAMSTRDKLAQLLMVGVTGAADARTAAAEYRVGGIMVGSWTDQSMLTDGSLPDIANSGPLPLAVSVDEEGGRVSRLSGLIGSQPSARVLAQTKTPDEVYAIARDRGAKMRGLGITIDFAPVVDVTDAPDNSVIGDRSFGADPTTVTDYAGAYARGLRDAGVLPVLKHFPGHGSGSGDTHTGSASTPSIEALKNHDLVPYRTLTTQAPVGVMVGHIEVPGLTGNEPASLSPQAYALLRSGGYGGPPFGGVVFTDDLSGMQAISARLGVPDAVLRALQAGADVALWLSTGEVPAVLDRLEKAVGDGELTMSGVDAAVSRIVAMKGPSPRCGG
ncbi:glycoside hydrolase family 3 N-terminal domain-containing protein [Mycolicibacterium parafortuitum]|uniref:beta-N-acetylhexosaminidase n=1 Tax=Mycolicibacterium parafortuitum TaxID=39692 RepID=A0A375YEH6_MYCPF|nr:glycoside hydrolase family 3 N-terminal domain-containing protein [Mycolicibacterium parafortuitum]ORB30155.1 beta-glucosidase [Mycolicibacterium parafortuitum]SRX79527.1 glycosyl hydrolase [Mycobacterium leprae TN] [Mycolicibacterium parafortuitum]